MPGHAARRAILEVHPMATGVGIDPARIAQLTEREEAHLNSETSGSARMYARSRSVMPNGVPSSYQARSPHPIFLERGVGSKVWDVDGSEYRDFHNGFGTMVQGHAHPLITKAVVERMPMGTHFAAATEDSVDRRRGAQAALGPAEVALHELRVRVDDGRHPPRARPHGPRARDQDGGLLPRPPRHGHGLDRDRHRRGARRPAEPAEQRLLRRRHPRLHGRADDPGAVQRRRRARRAPGRARRARSPA